MRPKTREIKKRLIDNFGYKKTLEIGGYHWGDRSYLEFFYDGKRVATLEGNKLYRLAKSIVRQFEE